MINVFALKRTDKLTDAQIQEIQEAKKKPQAYDEDCPVYDYDKLSSMLDKTTKNPIRSRLDL